MSEFVLAFSTAACRDEARTIASALVSEELAACVNIIESIHSLYRWQRAVESAAESLMLIKTRAALLPAIESRRGDLHSYEVAELSAVSIEHGAEPYLDWLLASTREPRKG